MNQNSMYLKVSVVLVILLTVFATPLVEHVALDWLHEYQDAPQVNDCRMVLAAVYSLMSACGLILLSIVFSVYYKWQTKKLLASPKETKATNPVGFYSKVDLYSDSNIKRAFKEGLTFRKDQIYHDRLNNAKDMDLEIKILVNEWWKNNKTKFRASYKAEG